jgi:hypothetical protein
MVVRLRNTNKQFWRRCRGTVVVSILEPSGPRIYLFRFVCFYLYPRYPWKVIPYIPFDPSGENL